MVERLKLITNLLLVYFCISCKLHDIRYVFVAVYWALLAYVFYVIPFLGDDAMYDRYDYMGYRLEYEEYDDEW